MIVSPQQQLAVRLGEDGVSTDFTITDTMLQFSHTVNIPHAKFEHDVPKEIRATQLTITVGFLIMMSRGSRFGTLYGMGGDQLRAKAKNIAFPINFTDKFK